MSEAKTGGYARVNASGERTKEEDKEKGEPGVSLLQAGM